MSQFTRLFKNHVNGVGFWEIGSENNVIKIRYATVLNGAVLEQDEVVPEGKQGRTLEQQVQHRIQSRINKQLDKGYVRTLEEAKLPPTNALNLLQPMLAQPLKRVSGKIDMSAVFVQYKYNGHRCLVTRQGGKTFAYSRQGKIIDTIDHILEDIDIPEGVTLDGELYCHGESLQTISSWAKRLQPDTAKLKYVIYDVIDQGSGYADRHHWLKERSFYQENLVELSPTFKLTKEVSLALKTVKAMHYEGLILRDPRKPYEPGRRSSSLIKVKSCIDAEFPVVDIVPSADGWGILVCMMPNGNTFRVSAPGTIGMKTHVLEHKEDFVGKSVTVEFAEYTKDKVPFHCVATGWREDL